MDAPPANRLLQLLRQKSQDSSEEQPSEPSSSSPGSTQPAIFSGTQPAKSSTQPAIFSGIQPATESGVQYDTKSGTQPAKSGTQPATESGVQYDTKSGTQPATESGSLFTMVGLSKGQERVLKYLLSIRDIHNPSQTVPVGYDSMSKSCFLSRNGARKVISEL